MTKTDRFELLGIVDDCDTCECCGRTGLKRTVVLAVLDADGNRDGEVYYGTACAARALGRTSAQVRNESEAFVGNLRNLAQTARDSLRYYGSAIHDEHELAAAYAHAHRNAIWAHKMTAGEWRDQAVEMVERHRATLAEAARYGVVL